MTWGLELDNLARADLRPADHLHGALRVSGGPPLTKRERDRRYDERRRADQPWRAWYKTPRWLRRRQAQLRAQPLCERCLAAGRVTPATVAHHVTPHRGDATLFFEGPLASSCKSCHDSTEHQIEMIGYSTEVGLDGLPTDPRHPFNAG